MVTSHDLLDAWRLNNDINRRLIDSISDAGMKSTMSTRGGRNVSQQFVHLHNVRWAWLHNANPALARGVTRLNPKAPTWKAQLKTSLTASCEAIGRWLAMAIDEGVRMKNFAGGPCKALGYFLAHDAHHRGSILLTLKLSGHRIDTKTQFGIWMIWHSRNKDL